MTRLILANRALKADQFHTFYSAGLEIKLPSQRPNNLAAVFRLAAFFQVHDIAAADVQIEAIFKVAI